MTTTDEALTEQIARAIADRVHVRGEGAWRDYRAYATAALPILRDLAESLAALAPDVLRAQADALREAAADMGEWGNASVVVAGDAFDEDTWVETSVTEWLTARATEIEDVTP